MMDKRKCMEQGGYWVSRKPCPFCWSSKTGVEIQESSSDYPKIIVGAVHCSRCNAKGGFCREKVNNASELEDAVETVKDEVERFWNRRYEE